MKNDCGNGVVNTSICDHHHEVTDFQLQMLFILPAYQHFPTNPIINIITVKDVDKWKKMKNGKHENEISLAPEKH